MFSWRNKKNQQKLNTKIANFRPPPKKQKVSEKEKRIQELKEDKQVKVKIQGYKEDPFYFCSQNDPVWPAIKYVGQGQKVKIKYSRTRKAYSFSSIP